jgi:hypothetical protein
MYKIKHTLKNLMFGQIDKYNNITVEFECKDRIVWDEKRKVVAHKFVSAITVQEQRTKFVRIFNPLGAVLNNL